MSPRLLLAFTPLFLHWLAMRWLILLWLACLLYACAQRKEEALPAIQQYGPDHVLGLSIQRDPHRQRYRLTDTDGQLLKEGSRQACEHARLQQLQQRHGSGYRNLALATLGGRQYWVDTVAHAGWRIQRHSLTQHYRLLDPRNRRRAWGSYPACRTALEQQRLRKNLTWPQPHLVILLHGLLRSPGSLRRLERHLQQQGFTTFNLTYASAQEDLASAAAALYQLLSELHGVVSVDFVTHSMGSLVLRQLLQDYPDLPLSIRRNVLIFPPSQGSAIAQRLHQWPLYRLVTGPGGQDLLPQVAAELPIPQQPSLIIAGNQGFGFGHLLGIRGEGDGTVQVSEAALSGIPMQVFPVGHSFGMNDRSVIEAVSLWLSTDSPEQECPR